MARLGSRTIERKNEQLDEDALAQVLRQVAANPGIATLRLVNAALTPSLAVQLADFLERNATLTHVDLAGNTRIGAHGVACLAESLAKNVTIQALSLAQCKLTSASLDAWRQFFIQGQNRTLKQLDLSNNQIQDDGGGSIAAIVEAVQTPGVSLDFRSNELADDSIKCIAEALKQPRSSIIRLRLEDNQDEASESLHHRIDYYLRRNLLAFERRELLATFRTIADSSPTVIICRFDHVLLALSDADLLASALAKSRSVAELRLQDNGLPPEATRRILIAMSANKSVLKLSIVDNNIGDIGFKALSTLLRAPSSALRSVRVSNSIHVRANDGMLKIMPRTGSALHYTFANYSLLTTVSLINCGLNDQLAGVVVSGMAWNCRVESLALTSNELTDRSVHMFVVLLHRCRSLYRLDLANNEFTLAGLVPLVTTAASHERLRMLLLGRFPDYDGPLINSQLLPTLRTSCALVRVELVTIVKRSRMAETLAALNAELASRHAGDAELERHARVLAEQRHEHWCWSRALVRGAARAFVADQLRLPG